MIEVIIPTFIKEKEIIDVSIIKDICLKSFNSESFFVSYEKRNNGRYIVLKKGNEVHYICLSASDKEYNGRNSFLSQFLGTAFTRFEELEVENKKLGVYLLSKKQYAFNSYQNFIYRCCRTLKINLLNIEKIILPFSSYKELKKVRSEISDRNMGNKSSYFSDTGDFIEFFAKSYGANGKESVFLAMVLRQLTDKQIIVYQVEDNGQKHLSIPDKKVLEKNKFKFGEVILSQEFKHVNLNIEEKDLRNQPAFRLNLFKKFGEKKCFLCDCDIDNLIIAAHIHRVIDIKNDSSLSDDEKRWQIIDGNNGFWLCANHDKLFEYGLVYFYNNDLILSESLTEEQKEFVYEITPSILDSAKTAQSKEEPSHYGNFRMDYKFSFNDETKKYLKLHKNRVLKK